jgi:hypothetical protein
MFMITILLYPKNISIFPYMYLSLDIFFKIVLLSYSSTVKRTV